MIVLGVNAYHADASAALFRDGVLVAAVEEERFCRVKHWAGFPREAIRSCLDMAGVIGADVDHVAISRDPRAHLGRKARFALSGGLGLRAIADRARNRARVLDVAGPLAEALGVERGRLAARVHQVEHHPAHLASAFLVSPFERAAVCAIDGFGDFVSTSCAVGEGETLTVDRRVYFPHSLGLVYLAITQFLGFHAFGDEYKVMGLAPYATPDFADRLRALVRLGPDGGFELDLSFFRHHAGGVSMTWEGGAPVVGPVWAPALEALLGPARRPGEDLAPRHEAIAASLQLVFEEVALHVLRALHGRTRLTALCLAGGCAMNSVLNGKIRAETPFTDLFVQPAAADNGTALGAAALVSSRVARNPRRFVMEHAAWGPEFDAPAVQKALAERSADLRRAACRVTELDPDERCRFAAAHLARGLIVGWFQGRMEWAARALGHRSILADPRRPDMRHIINTRIKLREKFRPFAPSIREEAVEDYFPGAPRDPFMMQVHPVRADKRAVIPAVVHVDGSARVQTVSRRTDPLYWELLSEFERLTGVPVLLNTSFNENEPIVLRPEEALDCFLRTRMDVLVAGPYAVVRAGDGAAPHPAGP